MVSHIRHRPRGAAESDDVDIDVDAAVIDSPTVDDAYVPVTTEISSGGAATGTSSDSSAVDEMLRATLSPRAAAGMM